MGNIKGTVEETAHKLKDSVGNIMGKVSDVVGGVLHGEQ